MTTDQLLTIKTPEGQAFRAEAARWASAVLTIAAQLLRDGEAFDPKSALRSARNKVFNDRKAVTGPLTGDQHKPKPGPAGEAFEVTNLAFEMPEGTTQEQAKAIADSVIAAAKESCAEEESPVDAIKRVAKDRGLKAVQLPKVPRDADGKPDTSDLLSMLEGVLGLKPRADMDLSGISPRGNFAEVINAMRESAGLGPCDNPNCAIHHPETALKADTEPTTTGPAA